MKSEFKNQKGTDEDERCTDDSINYRHVVLF
jgi:hypothetical protein